MLSRFCLQVLWIQRLCSCSPAKPMIPEDHRVRGIYPVCRSASCTRTTGVSSSQSRATSAFFVLHSTFEQLSPVLSRFYLQPLLIQRFCPCSPAKLMIPEDNRRVGYIFTAYLLCLLPTHRLGNHHPSLFFFSSRRRHT